MSPSHPHQGLDSSGFVQTLKERLAALVRDGYRAGLGTSASEVLAELGPWPDPYTEPEEQTQAGNGVPMQFGLVGDSPRMREVFALIERVASADVAVLVGGETGTGKELVARALHEYSPRRSGPFLAENCAAVPANLLESELFGHVKGAFTGADRDRSGHFVTAHEGTLLLDEIGDMPLAMQAKMLRVLETGEVRPVGSSRTRQVDVRLVAATHRDLEAMCAERTFREDLFFRLNVIRIQLPALRDREGDLLHLVNFFSARLAHDLGREVVFTPEAIQALQGWHWPGNVRELENELGRAVALSTGPIGPSQLSPQFQS